MTQNNFKIRNFNTIISNGYFDTKKGGKMAIYGYARISTGKQNIERQIRNIIGYNASAIIYQEEYTGTRIKTRPEWTKLCKRVQSGDTIIFDSVSRMSRNSKEGVETYFDLYEKGVNLVFLKEHYIDTDTYRNAIMNKIELIGTKEDILFTAINEYLKELAKEQIKIAFDQSEKEVLDLHKRTKEGMQTAKLNGKQIGRKTGVKVETKKSKIAKEFILKKNVTFNGNLTNEETWKLAGISKMSFYKYKSELIEQINNDV